MSLAQDEESKFDIAKLANALKEMQTRPKNSLSAHIDIVEDVDTISETKTNFRCYFVKNSPSGLPRVPEIVSDMKDAIINYCFPKSKISAVIDKCSQTYNADEFSALNTEARKLFAEVSASGEGGELLLYILSEAHLGLTQIIKKMPLKTNPQVHYHGADGVFTIYDKTSQKLALYWGEAKFKTDVKKAVSEALDSIKPFFIDDTGTHREADRDIKLISEHAEFDDHNIRRSFLEYLDMSNDRSSDCVWRSVILIGFSLENYHEVPGEKEDSQIQNEIQDAIVEWKKSIKRKLNIRSLQYIEIEFFFMPLPNVEKFRQLFQESLKL